MDFIPVVLFRKASRIFKDCADSLINFLYYLPCGGYTSFLNTCLDFISLEEGERVLDLCCGTGEFTGLVAGKKPSSIIGIDISIESIRKAIAESGQDNIFFIHASACDLPLRSGRFDKCLVSFGMHHLNRDDRRTTIFEIRRVISAEGILYVFDYNTPESILRRFLVLLISRFDESREAYRMIKAGTIIDEVLESGFTIERREEIGWGMYQLIEFRKANNS